MIISRNACHLVETLPKTAYDIDLAESSVRLNHSDLQAGLQEVHALSGGCWTWEHDVNAAHPMTGSTAPALWASCFSSHVILDLDLASWLLFAAVVRVSVYWKHSPTRQDAW